MAIKDASYNSWFIHINSTLHKYELQNAFELLENTPSKTAWKLTVDKAITSVYQESIHKQMAQKKSVKHISWSNMKLGEVASIWAVSAKDNNGSKKAQVKAKLLTGSYRLEVNKAKQNQNTVNPTCKLCKLETEDAEHFILRCPTLDKDRAHHMTAIKDIVGDLATSETDSGTWLQIILDCTHVTVGGLFSEQLAEQIERASYELIFALHLSRERALQEVVKQKVSSNTLSIRGAPQGGMSKQLN